MLFTSTGVYTKRAWLCPFSLSFRFRIHPTYQYKLAKLDEQKGLKNKAKAEYARFLDLRKDADLGQAGVDDAKKRLTEIAGIR